MSDRISNSAQTVHSTDLKAPLLMQPFSPVQFLIGTYDSAIEGCTIGDYDLATTSIHTLMLSLDVPHSRSAGRLFHLFEFCLDRLLNGDFQETKDVLEVIKEAWLKFAEFEKGPAGRA
ncbi:MAG: hypothetical protein QF473_00345 [Planctomycetota bacterium]|jgi:hypothetical protein|nr:hypothetical protein [Planctomycetota bacterium]